MEKSEGCGPLSTTSVTNVESNLQPVTRVGREERTAEHQDAPQNIFLGHLEREEGEVGES